MKITTEPRSSIFNVSIESGNATIVEDIAHGLNSIDEEVKEGARDLVKDIHMFENRSHNETDLIRDLMEYYGVTKEEILQSFEDEDQ